MSRKDSLTAEDVSLLTECHASLLAVKGVGIEEDMQLGTWVAAVDGPSRQDALGTLVKLGRVLLRTTHPARSDALLLARKCASLVGSASDAQQANVDAEILFCELETCTMDSEITATYSKASVDRRFELLDRCSRALQKARAVQSRSLLQQATCSVWGAVLPLLQPNLRHRARRPLEDAADALKEIESSMTQLRTVIYIELARIAYDNDLLVSCTDYVAYAEKFCASDDLTNQAQISQLRKQLKFAEIVEQNNGETDIEVASGLISLASEASNNNLRRRPLVQAGQILAPLLFGS